MSVVQMCMQVKDPCRVCQHERGVDTGGKTVTAFPHQVTVKAALTAASHNRQIQTLLGQ